MDKQIFCFWLKFIYFVTSIPAEVPGWTVLRTGSFLASFSKTSSLVLPIKCSTHSTQKQYVLDELEIVQLWNLPP